MTMNRDELADAARQVTVRLTAATASLLASAKAIYEVWELFGPQHRDNFYLWFDTEIHRHRVTDERAALRLQHAVPNGDEAQRRRRADRYVRIGKHYDTLMAIRDRLTEKSLPQLEAVVDALDPPQHP
jgi:hypothetical protein